MARPIRPLSVTAEQRKELQALLRRPSIKTVLDAALAKAPADAMLREAWGEFSKYQASYVNTVGGRVFMQAHEAGDKAGMAQAKGMVLSLLEESQRQLKLDPAHFEWWRDLSTSYATLSVISSKEGDASTALAHMMEAVRCLEKAAALMPDRLELPSLLAYRLYFATKLVWQQPTVDHDMAISLCKRSFMNWLRCHEGGYPAKETHTKLDSHIELLHGALKRSLESPAITQVVPALEDFKAVLGAALAKAPDDPLLKDGATKLAEYQATLLQMVKESQAKRDGDTVR